MYYKNWKHFSLQKIHQMKFILLNLCNSFSNCFFRLFFIIFPFLSLLFNLLIIFSFSYFSYQQLYLFDVSFPRIKFLCLLQCNNIESENKEIRSQNKILDYGFSFSPSTKISTIHECQRLAAPSFLMS